MSNEIASQLSALIDALLGKESEEKARYNAAVDIVDIKEAKDACRDSLARIQQLHQWTGKLIGLLDEVNDSFLSDAKISLQQFTSEFSLHVLNKLKKLCETDYRPADDKILNWQDGVWSKKIFGLDYPFAILLNDGQPVVQEEVGKRIADIYWEEVFSLGGNKFLFYNRWHQENQILFDLWYDALPLFEEPPLRKIVPIAEKEEVGSLPYLLDSGDDEENFFDSLVPGQMELLGSMRTVNSWEEVLINLCEEMILKKPHKMILLAVNKSIVAGGSPVMLQYAPDDSDRAYHELSNGMFVTKNISGDDAVSSGRAILKLCNYDVDALKIS